MNLKTNTIYPKMIQASSSLFLIVLVISCLFTSSLMAKTNTSSTSIMLEDSKVNLMADDVTVTGKVLDENGEGLPGATVLVKGTTSGTVTDANGSYKIEVPDGSIIVYSFVGYLTQEIQLGGRSVIDVTMELDLSTLEEVVVIGYGTQKKSDLTGAVGIVEGDEISKLVTGNATNTIQGRMAGVRVETSGGAPGSGAIVTIRGSGTLSDRQPLYVIDGMLTGSMSMLNPNDIESVTVLKDASATAIYGSRAANGVIVVTTKKGSKDKITIDLDMNYGNQSPTNTIPWANNEQYAQVIRDGYDNDAFRVGGTPVYPNDVSDMFDPSIDSDIQDETLRNAPITEMNLSLRGGGENGTYNFSVGRFFQEGIVEESSFERINLRFNSQVKKGRFTFEESIGLTRSINNPNNYFNRERDIVPTIPMYDEDGNFTARRADGATTHSQVGNSLGIATLEDRTVKTNRLLGTVAGSFEIIKGLTYKANFGLEAYQIHNKTFTPEYNFSDSPTNGFQDFDRLNERNDWGQTGLMEHTLNFQKSFGDHSVGVLAGYGVQKSNNRRLGAIVNTFPNSDIRNAQEGSVVEDTPSFNNTSGLVSYFGRANYTYKDKYLLTATIRQDKSSLFAEDLRTGTFPSVAVGWNISNEGFLSGFTAISNIKLRGSYGEMGSNNAPPYVGDAVINVNSSYPLGDSQEQVRNTGFSITQPVNEILQWETTTITNIGVDFTVLNNDLSITLDYFIKDSDDIIAPYTPPPWTGRAGDAVPTNMASIRNKGFEFLADYRKSFGDLVIGVSANFTILDNEVTDVGFSGPIVGGGWTSNGRSASLTQTGLPIGAFWGLKVEGIYQSEQEAIDDGRYILADPDDPNSERLPLAGGGDLNFQDLDGVPGNPSDADKQFLGSPIPDFEYGFNINAEYKGLDMTLFFNGVSGNKILNGNIYRAWFEADNNVFANMVDAWTPNNPSTSMPRMTHQDLGQNGTDMSDFLLEDGSYFRLAMFVLGYSLPSTVTDKIGLSKVRFYATGQNLFTITDYTGYYPIVGRGSRDRGASSENIFNAGVDENAYPMAKTFQMGVQISF